MEQNSNSKKLAQEWFSRADDDLLFAKAGFKETDIAADACFLSHQAVEKYLKGFIVLSVVEPKKSHNLSELLEECIKIIPDFLRINEECEFLNRFYNPTRYPGGIILNYDKETGAKALRVAEEVINFIQEKVK